MRCNVVHVGVVMIVLLGLPMLSACSTAPKSVEGKAEMITEADAALAKARRADPSLNPMLNSAAGYAVFPSVGKGAIGIGGAYGKGVLYERDYGTGYCDLSQASIGFQLGGQA